MTLTLTVRTISVSYIYKDRISSDIYLEDNFGVLESGPTRRTEGQFTVDPVPVLHPSTQGFNGHHLLLLVGHVKLPLIIKVKLARVQNGQIPQLFLIHFHLQQ